jgi:hypothetical protein
MKPKTILSVTDVRDIFQRKANGESNRSIGNRYNCSDSTISRVLHRDRGFYADVYITSDVLEAASKHMIFRGKNRDKKPCDTPPPDAGMALANYAAAIHALRLARNTCVMVGVNNATLDFLLELEMESKK